MYQLNSLYGPGARERMELEHLEREKREREIRELRERELNDRLKEEIMKSGMRGPPNPMDPHWLELQRRYAAAGLAGPSGTSINPIYYYNFQPGLIYPNRSSRITAAPLRPVPRRWW